ncbi:hypothetical protein FRC98_02425 [Lujinxingia vulgaris]|uniref:MYXO-CTERM domain-containing protein n=1 Tax=Lujinxingia vulgaris TaxID=2600176 RepID=A0A5C6XM25_9DELT|nr:MYXO-CTERM sorting domain-containing protein [Lujinxingia vulgaris]TXD39275.1 hypothetical protein FRC98_02425 [Lujinxingia vulgaris]
MRLEKVTGAALLGLAVGGAMTVGQVAVADACMPPLGQITDTYPSEGAVVAPDVKGWLFGFGAGQEPTIELRDADGQRVEATVLTTHLASFFGVARSLQPAQPLAEGTYTLSATYEHSPQNNVSSLFTVDAEAAWPAPPAPPVLTWYRETFDQAVGNSCEFGDEHHRIKLHPAAGAVAYRVELETEFDTALEIGPMVGRADIEHGITLGDVVCVRAYAIRGDGTESEASERCVPQKCRHYGRDESPGMLGTTDWSLVSEGSCPGEPGEGDDPSGGDVGGDAGFDVGEWPTDDVGPEPGDDVGPEPGDDVGPEPGDDVGDDPQVDAGDSVDAGSGDVGTGSGGDVALGDDGSQQAVSGGGCSSSGSPAGGALSLLVGALGVLVWRRRR